jgi:DNA-binding MarR family transcriptional regulator
MNTNLIISFQKYLKDTIGINLEIQKNLNIDVLPFFINDEYQLVEVKLLEHYFIVLMSKGKVEETPAKLKNHIELIRDKLHKEVIFLESDISPHNRQRLIAYKIPFVIPGNQMYLPDLMIDLRNHFKQKRAFNKYLSPSAQAVLIYIFNSGRTESITPGRLAEELNYSNMTLTRAFDELEGVQLFESITSGKERLLKISKNLYELWKAAIPYLRTPVKSIVYVKIHNTIWDRFRIAGLNALSQYTMISAPDLNELAINTNDYTDGLKKNIFYKTLDKEDADAKLEIWTYSPGFNLENLSIVDKYSLFLSLKNIEDERIEMALEDLSRGFKW